MPGIRLWDGFRGWRRTRPFWGGLAMSLGGLFVVAFPFTFIPQQFVTAGLAIGPFDASLGVRTAMVPIGYAAGLYLLVAGPLVWLRPHTRTLAGFLGILAGVTAFVAGHLGGFVVGMLLAIVGGAMCLAWTDQPRPSSRGRTSNKEVEHADLP